MKIKSFTYYLGLISFAMFTTSCIFSCSQDEDIRGLDEQSLLVTDSDPVKNESNSLQMVGAFESSLSSSLKSSDDGRLVYPEYYGGSNILSDGKLLVLVKGDTISAKKDLVQRFNSTDFKIESCEYSFNELSSLKKRLAEYFNQEKYREEFSWVSVGIYPSRNRVFVEFEDCSEQNIAAFKSKISNSPAIIYEQGGKGVADLIPSSDDDIVTRGIYGISPGSKINILGFDGSMAYRARYKGNEGFVTAGHCVPKVGGIVYFNGSYAGDGMVYLLGNKVDAAFVKTRSDYDVLDQTCYGKKYLTPTVIPISSLSSAAVTMEGFKSATPQYGVVQAVDVSLSFTKTMPYIGTKSYVVEYLIKASFPGQGGDSGGIVYGSTNMQIAGCFTGHNVDGTSRYFSYAGYINNAFGLSPY